VILDSLIGHDATDEENVDEAVPENLFEGGPSRSPRNPFGVDGNRKHACWREAHVLELLPVELRVAERELHAPGQRPQLLPAEGREPEHACVVRREERGRCDVVILQHASASEGGERLRHRRRQCEMEDRDVTRAG
jgi:hypothetical protein